MSKSRKNATAIALTTAAIAASPSALPANPYFVYKEHLGMPGRKGKADPVMRALYQADYRNSPDFYSLAEYRVKDGRLERYNDGIDKDVITLTREEFLAVAEKGDWRARPPRELANKLFKEPSWKPATKKDEAKYLKLVDKFKAHVLQHATAARNGFLRDIKDLNACIAACDSLEWGDDNKLRVRKS